MKKSFLALAVVASFSGAAQAQSNVLVYGSFDGGIRHQTDVNAAGNSRTTMGSLGTYNSNRIGFRGVEDLGGGLNARFTLESGFNTGTGALDVANTLFNRTASVGVGGPWGSVDFGRQYTVAFRTISLYEPFSYKYPVITGVAGTATAGIRFNNDIQYATTVGPITARAEYGLGEVASNASAGSSKAVGLSYQQGPVAAGAAYTNRRSPTDMESRHWTIGGAYKFGAARIALGHADQEAETGLAAGDATTKMSWVGVNYAISPQVEITGAYYRTKTGSSASAAADGKKDNYMLSGTYAFSKRTNAYVLLDFVKLGGAARVGAAEATPRDRQTGVAVGINHLF